MYLTKEECAKYLKKEVGDIDDMILQMAEDDIDMYIAEFGEGIFAPFIEQPFLAISDVLDDVLTIDMSLPLNFLKYTIITFVESGEEFEMLEEGKTNVISIPDTIDLENGEYKIKISQKKAPMMRDIILDDYHNLYKEIHRDIKKSVAYQYKAIEEDTLLPDNIKKERLQDDNYENEYFLGGASGVMINERVKTLIGYLNVQSL